MIFMSPTKEHVSSAGFTLLELVVVLGLICILSGIGTIGLLSWRSGYQLNRAAEDVQSILIRTRSRAVKDGADVTVRIDPGGNCIMEGIDGRVIYRNKIHPSVLVCGRETLVFRFNNRGLLSSRNGEVVLMVVDGETKRVVVNMIGRTRVEQVL